MNGTGQGLSTLEILRRARARLTGGGLFAFGDWNICTCGHIYAAATGREDDEWTVLAGLRRNAQLRDIFATVASVLGRDDQDHREPYVFVSDLTVDLDDPDDPTPAGSRDRAVVLIDRAIAAIEAQHERDRLDVLAQTREILNAADTPAAAVAA